MTRRDRIHKWTIYGLGLALVFVLDAYILPFFPIFGVSPMLLPTAVVAVAVHEGTFAGGAFGMVVGLLWEASYASGFGALVIILTLMGMAAGELAEHVLSQSILSGLLCSAGALVGLDTLRILSRILSRVADLSALLTVVVPECIVSMVCALPVLLLFRRIFNKVGGSRLA